MSVAQTLLNSASKRSKAHPRGTIAVPCNDLARYSAFTMAISTVHMPENSKISMVRSMDVTTNLNTIIRDMFEGEWMWFMGDDHVFDQNLLLDLLDREVDVVAPLCAKKNPPWNLVSFKSEELRTNEDDGITYPHYEYVEMSELPEEGLFEVHAVGSAGLLVRRHVLDAIGDPWFENSRGTVINDDLEFCRKIREAGFKIYVDTEAYLGHIGHYTVFPGTRDGRWGMTLDFGGSGTNQIFMTSPTAEELSNAS